jgi:NADPH2:quinone reductase
LKTNPDKKGDTILIHAAAGGVGLIAVQRAKLLGLRVIGTGSPRSTRREIAAPASHEIISTIARIATRIRG